MGCTLPGAARRRIDKCQLQPWRALLMDFQGWIPVSFEYLPEIMIDLRHA
nr:hypothetical protein [uncultured Ottowia sp.]